MLVCALDVHSRLTHSASEQSKHTRFLFMRTGKQWSLHPKMSSHTVRGACVCPLHAHSVAHCWWWASQQQQSSSSSTLFSDDARISCCWGVKTSVDMVSTACKNRRCARASTRLARSQFAKTNCSDFLWPKWSLNVLTMLVLIKRFANQHPHPVGSSEKVEALATTYDLLVQWKGSVDTTERPIRPYFSRVKQEKNT